MSEIIVDGKPYLTTRDVAEQWGLAISTVRKYANPETGIIPGCIKHGKMTLIPADAIRPITEPVAQGLLWAIIHIKNDPDSFLDLSQFGIDNSQLRAVLSELERKLLIICRDDANSERDRLLSCRITERGFALVQYRKQIENNRLKAAITPENIALVFAASQTLMQVCSLAAM